MTRLHTAPGGYDLFCNADWFYYRTNSSRDSSHHYDYFKNDLARNIAITAQEFNAAKYRADILPFEDGEEVVLMPDGGTIRCYFQNSTVRIFDSAGALLRTLAVTAGCTIYSIALDADGHLWTAEPSFHFVGQYDLATGQQVWALGGDWEPTEFNHPEDIAIYGAHAFISDMGNQRLVRLDTRSKSFENYRMFEQSVWQYRRLNEHELVRLDDGIYLL